MMTTTESMRVWVGCLACYSVGRLVGEWVDAVDAVDCVPCDMPEHDERWCFDTAGLPGVGECSPAEASQYAQTVASCAEGTDAPFAAVFAYLENFHGGVADTSALDSFEEAWWGEWESERAFAEQFAEDCGYADDTANPLTRYVDWERWTFDLFMTDFWSARNPNGGVFVFSSL